MKGDIFENSKKSHENSHDGKTSATTGIKRLDSIDSNKRSNKNHGSVVDKDNRSRTTTSATSTSTTTDTTHSISIEYFISYVNYATDLPFPTLQITGLETEYKYLLSKANKLFPEKNYVSVIVPPLPPPGGLTSVGSFYFGGTRGSGGHGGSSISSLSATGGSLSGGLNISVSRESSFGSGSSSTGGGGGGGIVRRSSNSSDDGREPPTPTAAATVSSLTPTAGRASRAGGFFMKTLKTAEPYSKWKKGRRCTKIASIYSGLLPKLMVTLHTLESCCDAAVTHLLTIITMACDGDVHASLTESSIAAFKPLLEGVISDRTEHLDNLDESLTECYGMLTAIEVELAHVRAAQAFGEETRRLLQRRTTNSSFTPVLHVPNSKGVSTATAGKVKAKDEHSAAAAFAAAVSTAAAAAAAPTPTTTTTANISDVLVAPVLAPARVPTDADTDMHTPVPPICGPAAVAVTVAPTLPQLQQSCALSGSPPPSSPLLAAPVPSNLLPTAGPLSFNFKLTVDNIDVTSIDKDTGEVYHHIPSVLRPAGEVSVEERVSSPQDRSNKERFRKLMERKKDEKENSADATGCAASVSVPVRTMFLPDVSDLRDRTTDMNDDNAQTEAGAGGVCYNPAQQDTEQLSWTTLRTRRRPSSDLPDIDTTAVVHSVSVDAINDDNGVYENASPGSFDTDSIDGDQLSLTFSDPESAGRSIGSSGAATATSQSPDLDGVGESGESDDVVFPHFDAFAGIADSAIDGAVGSTADGDADDCVSPRSESEIDIDIEVAVGETEMEIAAHAQFMGFDPRFTTADIVDTTEPKALVGFGSGVIGSNGFRTVSGSGLGSGHGSTGSLVGIGIASIDEDDDDEEFLGLEEAEDCEDSDSDSDSSSNDSGISSDSDDDVKQDCGGVTNDVSKEDKGEEEEDEEDEELMVSPDPPHGHQHQHQHSYSHNFHQQSQQSQQSHYSPAATPKSQLKPNSSPSNINNNRNNSSSDGGGGAGAGRKNISPERPPLSTRPSGNGSSIGCGTPPPHPLSSGSSASSSSSPRQCQQQYQHHSPSDLTQNQQSQHQSPTTDASHPKSPPVSYVSPLCRSKTGSPTAAILGEAGDITAGAGAGGRIGGVGPSTVAMLHSDGKAEAETDRNSASGNSATATATAPGPISAAAYAAAFSSPENGLAAGMSVCSIRSRSCHRVMNNVRDVIRQLEDVQHDELVKLEHVKENNSELVRLCDLANTLIQVLRGDLSGIGISRSVSSRSNRSGSGSSKGDSRPSSGTYSADAGLGLGGAVPSTLVLNGDSCLSSRDISGSSAMTATTTVSGASNPHTVDGAFRVLTSEPYTSVENISGNTSGYNSSKLSAWFSEHESRESAALLSSAASPAAVSNTVHTLSPAILTAVREISHRYEELYNSHFSNFLIQDGGRLRSSSIVSGISADSYNSSAGQQNSDGGTESRRSGFGMGTKMPYIPHIVTMLTGNGTGGGNHTNVSSVSNGNSGIHCREFSTDSNCSSTTSSACSSNKSSPAAGCMSPSGKPRTVRRKSVAAIPGIPPQAQVDPNVLAQIKPSVGSRMSKMLNPLTYLGVGGGGSRSPSPVNPLSYLTGKSGSISVSRTPSPGASSGNNNTSGGHSHSHGHGHVGAVGVGVGGGRGMGIMPHSKSVGSSLFQGHSRGHSNGSTASTGSSRDRDSPVTLSVAVHNSNNSSSNNSPALPSPHLAAASSAASIAAAPKGTTPDATAVAAPAAPALMSTADAVTIAALNYRPQAWSPIDFITSNNGASSPISTPLSCDHENDNTTSSSVSVSGSVSPKIKTSERDRDRDRERDRERDRLEFEHTRDSIAAQHIHFIDGDALAALTVLTATVAQTTTGSSTAAAGTGAGSISNGNAEGKAAATSPISGSTSPPTFFSISASAGASVSNSNSPGKAGGTSVGSGIDSTDSKSSHALPVPRSLSVLTETPTYDTGTSATITVIKKLLKHLMEYLLQAQDVSSMIQHICAVYEDVKAYESCK